MCFKFYKKCSIWHLANNANRIMTWDKGVIFCHNFSTFDTEWDHINDRVMQSTYLMTRTINHLMWKLVDIIHLALHNKLSWMSVFTIHFRQCYLTYCQTNIWYQVNENSSQIFYQFMRFSILMAKKGRWK